MPFAKRLTWSDDALVDVDTEVFELLRLERQRQQASLHMLAPSMIVPQAVRECLVSELGNLDGEGYVKRLAADFTAHHDAYMANGPAKYNPSGPIAEYIEALACRRLAEAFRPAEHPELVANLQPASGSLANLAICHGLVPRGGVIVSLALDSGGHLSHGAEVHSLSSEYRYVHHRLARDSGDLDYESLRDVLMREQPSAVFLGASSFPRFIDWKRIRDLIQEAVKRTCFLVADVAHFAGLVTTGFYPNPFPHADVVSLVGYKTFGGPKSGAILARNSELISRIDRALFPGLQGAPRLSEIAGFATAAKTACSEGYRSLIGSAVSFAGHLVEELVHRGIEIAFGGTDTHMVLLDVGPQAVQVAAKLERLGIIVNANMLPEDKSPARSSGIRLGTVALAQRFGEQLDVAAVAELIADSINSDANDPNVSAALRRRIRDLCEANTALTWQSN